MTEEIRLDVERLGELIRDIRGDRRQEEIAEAAGVSVSFMSRVERGQYRNVRLPTLAAIARALDEPIERLLVALLHDELGDGRVIGQENRELEPDEDPSTVPSGVLLIRSKLDDVARVAGQLARHAGTTIPVPSLTSAEVELLLELPAIVEGLKVLQAEVQKELEELRVARNAYELATYEAKVSFENRRNEEAGLQLPGAGSSGSVVEDDA